MKYLLFDADRKDFDDGNGNSVSLGEHLQYVDNYGGSPENFDSFEAEYRSQAIRIAHRKTTKKAYLVSENDMRVTAIINNDV